MPGVDACPYRQRDHAATFDHIDQSPTTGVALVTTILAVAIVLISFIAIGIAVADTARFVRRTGNQAPADLAYRAYLA